LEKNASVKSELSKFQGSHFGISGCKSCKRRVFDLGRSKTGPSRVLSLAFVLKFHAGKVQLFWRFSGFFVLVLIN